MESLFHERSDIAYTNMFTINELVPMQIINRRMEYSDLMDN